LQISKTIIKLINKIKENNNCKEEINKVLEKEIILKPFAFRCWKYEVERGYQFVSWFKNDLLGEMPPVISTTFYKEGEETFCQSRYGIVYEVTMDGFLGACNKDAATLIEKEKETSIFTIGKIGDEKIINSYNLATLIVTPTQVLNKETNNYKSKHNEIIVDARYSKPISIICMNENDLEMVSKISQKYNIPIDRKEVRNNK